MLNTNTVFKKRRSFKVYSRALEVVCFIIFVIYSISFLLPMLFTFLNSLKTRQEYMESVVALPSQWLFSNYIKAFDILSASGKSVVTMFLNSLMISVGKPTINLATAAMASYVMAKYKFPGRKLIWTIMIVIMIIPIYGSTASTYKLYAQLGIYDTPFLLLTGICGLGGSMLLIASFESLSRTYMEAAFIDGASHLQIFVQIMLPQVFGILTALWILEFITQWNNYMWPLMYMPSYTPLTTGLYIYQKEQSRKVNIPILFAGAMMCITPAVTLFFVFNDKLMNLSYGGGIKG